jgi:hypothetical protein
MLPSAIVLISKSRAEMKNAKNETRDERRKKAHKASKIVAALASMQWHISPT